MSCRSRARPSPRSPSCPASGQRRRQTLQTHTKYTVLPCFRPTSTADAANAHQVHSLALLQANGRRCKRTPSTQSYPASGRRQTLQTHTKYTVLPCFRPTSTADAANAHQVHSLTLLQANVDGRSCKRTPSTQAYPASGQRRRQTLQTHTKYTVLPCFRPTSTADAANAHQVHSLALLQANVDGRRCKRTPSTQSYPASGQRRRQTLQTHTKHAEHSTTRSAVPNAITIRDDFISGWFSPFSKVSYKVLIFIFHGTTGKQKVN